MKFEKEPRVHHVEWDVAKFGAQDFFNLFELLFAGDDPILDIYGYATIAKPLSMVVFT